MTMIASNLHAVQARIVQACNASGRAPQTVALLAVSKTFDAAAVRQAHACGQSMFGENYIQEAVEKMALLSDLPLQWHCIGPIQSNKTRLVAQHFDWAHSIDRLKTAQRLSAQRTPQQAPLNVCIQVNMDGEAAKAGVPPADVPALAHQIAALAHLRLRGLMTLPAPPGVGREDAGDAGDAAVWRAHQQARQLFDALNQQGLALDTLSMGMSADLEAAVQCGSTMVRVGSAIFGARNYGAG